jgi:hypothetical protein
MIRSRFAAAAVGVLAAGTLLAIAAPAMAVPTAPAACPTPSATPPLYTAKCSVTPTAGPGAMSYTVTVPGVGSVVLTLTPTGTLDTSTAPLIQGQGTFEVKSLKVNNAGSEMSVTFVAPAVTTTTPGTPKQVYTVNIKVTPGVGTAAPTVAAVVSPRADHHGNHDGHDGKDGKEGKDGDDDGAPPAGPPASPVKPMSMTHGDSHGGGQD